MRRLTAGRVVLLSALTFVGGNWIAKRSGTFRNIWTR